MKCVEENSEVIALADVAVAHLLARDDAVVIGVVQPRADIQRLTIGDDADLGALGDRLAFVQLTLNEPGDGRDIAPGRIVEAAVYNWRRRDYAGSSGRALGGAEQQW